MCRAVWPKHRPDGTGHWNAKRRQAGIRDAPESIGGPSGIDVLAGKATVSMDHLLAEIRYSTEHLWQPTADDLTHFCTALNQRAKRPLLTHTGTQLIRL